MRATFFAETETVLSEPEVLEMVTPDVLEKIKAMNPEPRIMAYVIAHEGHVLGNALELGQRVLHYTGAVLKGLFDTLPLGTKVFHKHGATNEHDGRVQIGIVVGKALRNVNDQLSVVVATYLGRNDAPLDVASIESDMEYEELPDGSLKVSDAQVTGLALASSGEESPGFPHARLVGAAAFFTGPDGEQLDFSRPENNDFIPGGDAPGAEAPTGNDFIPER